MVSPVLIFSRQKNHNRYHMLFQFFTAFSAILFPHMLMKSQKYPEYFELTHSKGIEVYVWQIAENIYRCGLMSGTNRNKTEEEILALQSSPLTIAEAKIILNELGVKNSDVFTYAITQPDTLYSYEVNENYRKTVENLFK